VTVVLWVAAGVVVAGCGTQTHGTAAITRSVPDSHFGPFGGYVRNGEVHRLGAVLIVPTIRPTSPAGVAGGWIGAEANFNQKTLLAPFFQIGVNEISGRSPDGELTTRYYVFWSSTKVGFHPKYVFTVRPGDHVRLSMALGGGHWRMVASDETTGRSHTIRVRSGHESFSVAQWAQEDVAKDSAGSESPYPILGPVAFSHLSVDSQTPTRDSLQRTWMSTDRGTFGPTPLSKGAFVMKEEHLSAADIRYQRIAFALNVRSIQFGRLLQKATQKNTSPALRAAARGFAAALERNADAFRNFTWPRDVRALVKKLVAASERSRQSVLALASAQASGRARATAAYSKWGVEVSDLALRIKARLHMPPSNYSAPSVIHYSNS
jgi:hypothetical protein